ENLPDHIQPPPPQEHRRSAVLALVRLTPHHLDRIRITPGHPSGHLPHIRAHVPARPWAGHPAPVRLPGTALRPVPRQAKATNAGGGGAAPGGRRFPTPPPLRPC